MKRTPESLENAGEYAMKIYVEYLAFDDIQAYKTLADFQEVVMFCEETFEFQDEQWKMAKTSGDMEKLYEYLYQNGFDVEMIDK